MGNLLWAKPVATVDSQQPATTEDLQVSNLSNGPGESDARREPDAFEALRIARYIEEDDPLAIAAYSAGRNAGFGSRLEQVAHALAMVQLYQEQARRIQRGRQPDQRRPAMSVLGDEPRLAGSRAVAAEAAATEAASVAVDPAAAAAAVDPDVSINLLHIGARFDDDKGTR